MLVSPFFLSLIHIYRTGRSWNALTIWSDIWNGEWETNDLNDAIGICLLYTSRCV